MEKQDIKIAIVEDEAIIATSLYNILKNSGYQPLKPSSSYEEGIDQIEQNKVQLALIDIRLKGLKSGIDLAKKINENANIPIIFISAFSDHMTLNEAKKLNPSSFLVKPVGKNQLLAAIEMAIDQPYVEDDQNLDPTVDDLIIKDGYKYVHIQIPEIVYVESDRNYMTYVLESGKKIIERITMKQLQEKLKPYGFIKINRSQIIQLSKVDSIEKNQVRIGKFLFKASKPIRKHLLTAITKTQIKS